MESCREPSGKSIADIQYESICEPIKGLFPQADPEAWHEELLGNGLFEPSEWEQLEQFLKAAEGQKIWQIVQSEYELLRKLWRGPDVPIYILPITKVNPRPSEPMPKKNGVAYRRAIFLFLSAQLSAEELRALFAHEYNHICRFDYVNRPPYDIELSDSLIIEGLGEYAVSELYDAKCLAPWTSMYSLEEALAIWQAYFVPAINVKGVNRHRPYLYGDPNTQLPKWIGYYIGYQIVHSFQKKCGPFHMKELLEKTAEDIITGSSFAIHTE